MKDPQAAYWDGIGATKTFTHPLNPDWLAGWSRNARVLDYGCGYGRVMAELSAHGFRDLVGADPSAALIARGRRLRPDLRFTVLSSPALAYPSGSFDLVVLFAVLTCVPDDAAQREIVTELDRVLAPGGLLYVSDLLLQDDPRNRARYAAHARQSGARYGVFATGDGAVCRHHDVAYLRALLSDFELVDELLIDVATMNGNPSRAVQLLVRKR
ncbi:class I SAM-dependent methyltransferase [Actinocrinis puniceicyclus]|uniref:Class I SAM-dependent methyltransferase n=1 Tax=Actinocrinis puniceicyclus TaxID=977794 RepID=A0A8J8BDV2_9ACTN|nr:class I SAM-dependent methyltransferase [Actinocrinis puniceicyclus]MBS2963159.1 class I SAM-dependent methyltransferase [Actinocrinis puniceicyclus]